MTVLHNNILERMSQEERRKHGKAGMTATEAAEKQTVKSEREVQNQIANWLRLRGIWYDQDPMHKRRVGRLGTPDFLLAHKGVPVAIEVKFGNGKLSPEQEKAFREMQNNGWRTCVARSLTDVIQFLQEVAQ